MWIGISPPFFFFCRQQQLWQEMFDCYNCTQHILVFKMILHIFLQLLSILTEVTSPAFQSTYSNIHIVLVSEDTITPRLTQHLGSQNLQVSWVSDNIHCWIPTMFQHSPRCWGKKEPLIRQWAPLPKKQAWEVGNILRQTINKLK